MIYIVPMIQDSEAPDRTDRTKKIALGIALFVLISFVLKAASSITLPLAVSFFLFLILNPMVNKMEQNRIPRWLAIVFAILLLLLFFVLLFFFFTIAINSFINRVPKYFARFDEVFGSFGETLGPALGLTPGSGLSELVDWKSMLINAVTVASGSIVNIISSSIIIFIFVLFLLLERQSLIPKVKVALPNRGSMRLAIMFERINRQISRYLVVKSIISLITGVLFYFGSLAVGLDFAIIWGVLAVMFNFIPNIGSIIITLLTIVMSVLQFFPDYGRIIYVAMIMSMIQLVMGNILDPRFQGNQLNLSPFIILVSLAFWGYIWGIMGMFLAVPIMSIVQIFCSNVKGLRPLSVMFSSGKRYRAQIREEDRRRKERYERMREQRREKRKQG